MNDDLFYWVWYTCNFVNAAEKARISSPNKTISAVFSEFIDENPQVRENRDKFTLVNQGLIIMLAYGICIIPAEERFNGFANSQLPIQSMGLFRVIKDKKSVMGDRAKFLKKIRDAIAHVNIDFLPNLSVDDPAGVELWTIEDSGKGDIDFLVTISVRELLKFLNEIGHQFGDYLGITYHHN